MICVSHDDGSAIGPRALDLKDILRLLEGIMKGEVTV